MSCPHGEWHEEDCAICVAENDTDEVDELRQAMRNLSSKYNELSVENERLECCGNCAVWWDNVQGRPNGCMGRPAQERCHFAPSRWKKP